MRSECSEGTGEISSYIDIRRSVLITLRYSYGKTYEYSVDKYAFFASATTVAQYRIIRNARRRSRIQVCFNIKKTYLEV